MAPALRFCLLALLPPLQAGLPVQRSTAVPAPPNPMPLQVERLDPALDRIVPAGALLETLATGLTWTEGPLWISAQGSAPGHLLFADIRTNSIRSLVPGQPAAVWLQPAGIRTDAPWPVPEPGTNGMTLDPAGRVVVAGHGLRNVLRFDTPDPHGPVTVLADSFEGKPFNSPNDLAFGPQGELVFTDPPYGLSTQDDRAREKVLPWNGVYLLTGAASLPAGAAPANGSVRMLVKDLPRPNGVAFSPDGRTLYLANTSPRQWWRYPVHPEALARKTGNSTGYLGAGTLIADASADPRPGSPDGLKVDTAGNLYGSGPGGIWLFSPAGKHLGTLLLPKGASNLAWGGPDRHTLFITDTDQVLSVHLLSTGLTP